MATEEPRRPFSGLEIATQWAQLPPEHLRLALKALELQLAREHETRMAELYIELRQQKDRRAHIRNLAGLAAGFAIAISTLVGAVILGVSGQPLLAAGFTGPSLLVLVKIFVLRQATAQDLQQVRKAQSAFDRYRPDLDQGVPTEPKR